MYIIFNFPITTIGGNCPIGLDGSTNANSSLPVSTSTLNQAFDPEQTLASNTSVNHSAYPSREHSIYKKLKTCQMILFALFSWNVLMFVFI